MAFADLQGRYGLSPATMAGLAQIAGQPTPDQTTFDSSGGPGVAEPTQQGAPMGSAGGPAPSPEASLPSAAPDNGGGFLSGGTQARIIEGPDGEPMSPAPAAPEASEVATPSGPSSRYVGGSAGQVVPAHWQPGSHAVSMNRGMGADELQEGQYNRDVSAGHALMAADERLEAAQIRAKADATYAADRIKAEDQLQTQMAAIQQRRDAYVADQKKVLDQASAEASKKEDPQAFFKEAGTMGTIWAGLMVGLGQFSSAMTGTPNAALNIINGAIDRNIAAQRANIAGAQKKYDRLNSLYDKNLQLFGDDERAALATKVQYLDKVAAMADAEKAKAGPIEASVQNHALIQSIYSERAKAADEFAKLSHTQISEQSNEHFVPAQVVGASAPKREENLVTASDGTTYVMPSKEVAGDAIKKIQVLGQLQRNNNEILSLRKQAEKLDPIGDYTAYNTAIAKLKDLGEQKVSLMSLALGQGVVKEEEYKRAQELNVGITNGLGTFKGNPIAKSTRDQTNAMLVSQVQRWGKDENAYLTAAGADVYKPEYVRTPQGLRPTGQFTGQRAKPTQNLAPAGFVPRRPGQEAATAQPPMETQIPYAPVVDGTVRR